VGARLRLVLDVCVCVCVCVVRLRLVGCANVCKPTHIRTRLVCDGEGLQGVALHHRGGVGEFLGIHVGGRVAVALRVRVSVRVRVRVTVRVTPN